MTCHGARVVDSEKNETLYEDVIPPEDAAQLMALLEGRGLYNEIAANATIYLEKAIADTLDRQPVPEHHLWYMRDRCYTALEKPSEFIRKNGVGVEKMNIYGVPAELQQEIYDAVTATGFIKHTRPGAGPNLEFSHRTLDKIKATDTLLEKLGISYAETMAIGDSSSDLEIIRRCGVGVAMGNAPENIKREADDVTVVNTEDGVALAFEKYVL